MWLLAIVRGFRRLAVWHTCVGRSRQPGPKHLKFAWHSCVSQAIERLLVDLQFAALGDRVDLVRPLGWPRINEVILTSGIGHVRQPNECLLIDLQFAALGDRAVSCVRPSGSPAMGEVTSTSGLGDVRPMHIPTFLRAVSWQPGPKHMECSYR